MNREEAKTVLERKLADLVPDSAPADYMAYKTVGSNLADDGPLPKPYMVYLTLVEIMGFPSVWMPFEKTLWSIPVRFKGRQLLVEHGKFGLRLSATGAEDDRLLAKEFAVLLGESFPITQRAFDKDIEDQVRAGRITVPNRFHQLDGRYRFFRESAERAFAAPPEPMRVVRNDEKGRPMAWTGDPLRPRREGSYHAIAAVDAYFSRLEHLLILAFAFSGYTPGESDLLEFIGARWSVKFTTILDFSKEKEAHRIYDRLVDVKRSYRNRAAHGGIDRQGGALYAHFGRLGAIPVSISEEQTGSLFPIDNSSFEEITGVFDRCDEYLAEGPLRAAWQYASAGFDVPYDPASIARHRSYAAMAEDELEEELEALGYRLDQQANMEW